VSSLVQFLFKFSFVYVSLCAAALAQEPAAKPPEAAPPSGKAAAAKSEERPALPFQIQLLETHVRFESNGDSRKEVHTIVKVNDLAGARQFSRLGFDYNRAFQQVEIPLVKISHVNGGTSEILPGAITDAPNPAVQDFPAYHDVRVKSVRILGLQDGDTIEYRVITTTTKHPLAPDFWLEHTFDRSGQVVKEIYELDLPTRLFEPTPALADGTLTPGALRLPPELAVLASPSPPMGRIYVSTETPETSKTHREGEDGQRLVYRWDLTPKARSGSDIPSTASMTLFDVVISADGWVGLSERIKIKLWHCGWNCESAVIRTQYGKLISSTKSPREALFALYDFVARRIATVDLPLGATGFVARAPDEILSSGYGTPEEKAVLLLALLRESGPNGSFVLAGPNDPETQLARPSLFTNILVVFQSPEREWFLDPAAEIAPLGAVRADLRGRAGLWLSHPGMGSSGFTLPKVWKGIPLELPYKSTQTVAVNAAISTPGELKSIVKYTMRGDNEMVLRLAFHQTPKERWKEVAGLLALSDGFRGTITNVMASDPMATKEPFTVEYEITQAKFVDWSKKPVRIPALLPQIALPDLPAKTAGKIELGTPLDVQTSLTLRLPEGTTVQTPAATSVARDYATFASKYDGHLNTVTVSRRIDFLKREIPSERAADYNAFLRAVQNDQAQMLVLLPPSATAATTP
jgi:hypothetical protein